MSSVQLWLRLEGLCVLTLSVFFYAQLGGAWLLFLLLLFVPDLGMLGYFRGPRVGAFVYNLIHAYVLPGLMLLAGLTLSPALLPFALIWLAHIGLDRLLGYGLKYPEGFKVTHLSGSRAERR